MGVDEGVGDGSMVGVLLGGAGVAVKIGGKVGVGSAASAVETGVEVACGAIGVAVGLESQAASTASTSKAAKVAHPARTGRVVRLPGVIGWGEVVGITIFSCSDERLTINGG